MTSSTSPALNNFLIESLKLGKKIHEDLIVAQKLFEQIENDTTFDAIIIQNEDSENFINECKSYATVVEDWSRSYPVLLRDFQIILKGIIENIAQTEELQISTAGNTVTIRFNEKEFIYNFVQEHPHQEASLQKQAQQIGATEATLVQEVAEIISLDMHIERFLVEIARLTQEYKVGERTAAVKNVSSVKDPGFVENMHTLAEWWLKIHSILDSLKKVMHKAVELDERVAKKLDALFTAAQRLQMNQTRLKIAKKGLCILGGILLNLIPGGGIVSSAVSAIELGKLTREAVQTL